MSYTEQFASKVLWRPLWMKNSVGSLMTTNGLSMSLSLGFYTSPIPIVSEIFCRTWGSPRVVDLVWKMALLVAWHPLTTFWVLGQKIEEIKQCHLLDHHYRFLLCSGFSLEISCMGADQGEPRFVSGSPLCCTSSGHLHLGKVVAENCDSCFPTWLQGTPQNAWQLSLQSLGPDAQLM